MLFAKTSIALIVLAALTGAAPLKKKSKTTPIPMNFKVVKESHYEKSFRNTKLPKTQGSNSTLSGLPAASSACPLGSFNETESESYTSLNKAFALYYGVKGYYTYAKGEWSTEDVTWGDVTVKDMQLGLATDQDIGQGIVGISYRGTEGIRNVSQEYPNFPEELKNQGLIKKNAYSLYLNTEEATSGTILFGGIDKAKFDGELTMFHLNSGSTLLYVLPDIYKSVTPKCGTWNETVGAYITPCAGEEENFKFQFSNLTIEVPYKQLLYSVSDPDSLFLDGNGVEQCIFSLLTTSMDTWILGDVFLRSAYIYYDLDDNKISLAQAVYTNETDIISV